MLEFYHVKYPKARKEHVCDLCGSKIPLGQTYERYSGKYDGNMFDLKYCLNCEKIIDTFLDENECDEYSDDDIYDWLAEKFCYDCKHGWHRDDALDDCTTNRFCCPTILAKIKKITEYIVVTTYKDSIVFPYFTKGTMYKGMKLETKYELKELGIEYNE